MTALLSSLSGVKTQSTKNPWKWTQLWNTSQIRNRQATEKIESIVVSKIKSSFVSNSLKIVLKYSCWSIYSVYVNFIVIGDTDNYLEKKQRW